MQPIRTLAFAASAVLFTLPALAAAPSAGPSASPSTGPSAGASTGPSEMPGPVRLNAGSIDKVADVMNGVVDAVKKDPSILNEIPSCGSEQETLDQWARRIDSSPHLSAIFKKAGMSPRDYVVSLLSLAQAQAYSFASKEGQPPKSPDPVVIDNAKLIEGHPAQMKRLADAGARLEALEQQEAPAGEEPGAPGGGAGPQSGMSSSPSSDPGGDNGQAPAARPGTGKTSNGGKAGTGSGGADSGTTGTSTTPRAGASGGIGNGQTTPSGSNAGGSSGNGSGNGGR